MSLDLVEIIGCYLLVIFKPDDVSAKTHPCQINLMAFLQSPAQRTDFHPPSSSVQYLVGDFVVGEHHPCSRSPALDKEKNAKARGHAMAMRLNLVSFFYFCQLPTSICPHLHEGHHGCYAPSNTDSTTHHQFGSTLRCKNLMCG